MIPQGYKRFLLAAKSGPGILKSLQASILICTCKWASNGRILRPYTTAYMIFYLWYFTKHMSKNRKQIKHLGKTHLRRPPKANSSKKFHWIVVFRVEWKPIHFSRQKKIACSLFILNFVVKDKHLILHIPRDIRLYQKQSSIRPPSKRPAWVMQYFKHCVMRNTFQWSKYGTLCLEIT